MTSLDIVFWLLAALLGGTIWAVEAGLANRHRNVILSSMASTLLSMLFIMFWVEDKTQLVPLEPEVFAKTKGQGGGRGQLDFGPGSEGGGGGGGGGAGQSGGDAADDAGGGSGGDGGGGGGSGGGSGNTASEGGSTQAIADLTDPHAKTTHYSREPFKDCPACPDMVIVPKGAAHVGAGSDDPHRQPSERAKATIPMPKPLAVGRLEILRGEFSAFVEETKFQSRTQCDAGRRRGLFNWQRPGFEQDERHPVVCLSWPEVRLYLAWLSEKSGRTYRLPTEVEWEYAARAGTETPYSIGFSLARRDANVARTRDGTTVGGLFSMNPWGLSDTIGNAFEMTSQCEGEAGAVVDIRPEQTDCRRLLKSGSWAAGAVAARHASRRFINDGFASNDIGFRVVRDVDERDDDKLLTVAQKKILDQADLDAAEIEARERQAVEDEKRKVREEAEAAKAKAAKK